MSLKNDKWIKENAAKGMIKPFCDRMVRTREVLHHGENNKVISYGLGSYGYDIRLSGETGSFGVFRHIPGTVVDPKNFNRNNLEDAPLHTDKNGSYYILPALSYGLGVAVEKLEVPKDVTIICVGKSTYARAGIIANITPAEASWRGFLTLEFSNSSGADCRIYANEGVVQLLFLQGEECETSYSERVGGGKYQDQQKEITLARV